MKYFIIHSEVELQNVIKLEDEYYCVPETDIDTYIIKYNIQVLGVISKTRLRQLKKACNLISELKINEVYKDLFSVKQFNNMRLVRISKKYYYFVCDEYEIKVDKNQCKVSSKPLMTL